MRKDELIKKINDLKEGADDSTALLYNEIINELNNTKKYGLVWDTEHTKEDVVLKCEKEIPILSLDESKTIINGGQNNILIEGDNYHSLIALNMIAKESIDVIYIDPPYNTGKKDFVYNDNFIDEENSFKHSSWLSFMEKRLLLSKDLLKDDGVIFISIDDHEFSQLKLLCDSIFSERAFINNFMWLHGKGKKNKQSRTLQQYVLAYCKNNRDILNEWVTVRQAKGSFTNPDNDPNGPWFSGSISFSEERSNKKSEKYFTVTSPSGIEWTRQWMCTKEEMDEYLKNNKIYFGPSPAFSNTPRLKIYPSDTNELIPDNIIENCSSTRSAQKELDDIIGKTKNSKNKTVSKFDNPKPSDLIKHLITITNKNNNIKVLDFFAGSGTTGQAVLELNKEDGGNRKFILCTNNENNICEEVTYQRLKTVISGKREDGSKYSDGLDGNLYYLKTDFINDENNEDQAKYNLVEKVDVLLCIKEDLFIQKHRSKCFSAFTNSDENKHMFIYNDHYNEKSFNDFKDIIEKTNGKKIVYVYSTDNNVDESLFENLKDVELKTIPSKIYEIYKEIVEDIKRG